MPLLGVIFGLTTLIICCIGGAPVLGVIMAAAFVVSGALAKPA